MRSNQPICLFLCGDVMTGWGVDQVLPHPGNPVLRLFTVQGLPSTALFAFPGVMRALVMLLNVGVRILAG
jgi:hypothetical protein